MDFILKGIWSKYMIIRVSTKKWLTTKHLSAKNLKLLYPWNVKMNINLLWWRHAYFLPQEIHPQSFTFNIFNVYLFLFQKNLFLYFIILLGAICFIWERRNEAEYSLSLILKNWKCIFPEFISIGRVNSPPKQL